MTVVGGAVRVRVLGWRPGLLPVESQVISWQREAVGEALHGLAQAWARVSRVLWFVSVEAEPVQREAML